MPTSGYLSSNFLTQSLSTSRSAAYRSAHFAFRSFGSSYTFASAREQWIPAKQLYGPPLP